MSKINWFKNSEHNRLVEKAFRDRRFIVGLAVVFVIVFSAVFAPLLAPFGPEDLDIARRLLPPSLEHWLGCDLNGGDVFTSLLYGARTSLYIGFFVIVLSFTVGVFLGLLSGFRGGWIDAVLMRIVDILLAFPGILFAMALTAILGPSTHNIILAISATGWISTARLVRGQVLTVREREFVVANVALGAPEIRTLVLHVLPSVVPHLIVHATFSLSGVIIVESSLSFLGLGPTTGSPTWGALLSQGKSVMLEAPILTIAPGIAIMLVVLALNFLGDSLRDVLDPKST